MTWCVVMCWIVLRCVVVWRGVVYFVVLFLGGGERMITRAAPGSANKTSNQYTGGMYVDYVPCQAKVTIKDLPRGSGRKQWCSRRRFENI